MLYRYRMHSFSDPSAPLGPGRPLFGRSPDEAISNAADLWKAGAYVSALGYRVVDTEDGAVLCQQQRDHSQQRPLHSRPFASHERLAR